MTAIAMLNLKGASNQIQSVGKWGDLLDARTYYEVYRDATR